MADGDGEGVCGVGGRWRLGEAEERLHHERDMLLGAAAVGGEELLDLGRLVEGHRQAGAGGGEGRCGARFADGDGGTSVSEDEVFDGDFLRLVLGDYVENSLVDAHEALGDGGLCRWANGAEGDGAVRRAVGDDDAVAGDGESGVDAEDRDGA